MRRMLAVFLILFLATPANLDTILFAQAGSCADCQPGRLGNGWDVAGGDLNVCFISNSYHTWGVDERTYWMGGMTRWTDLMSQQGRTITLHQEIPSDPNSCSDGSIKVVFVPQGDLDRPGDYAEALGTSDGRNGQISINKDLIDSSYGNWGSPGGHEFGHFFDFANITKSGCGTHSLMAMENTYIDDDDGCGDQLAVTTRYKGDNSSDEYYSDPRGGDCYEWLTIMVWEAWDGSEWLYDGWDLLSDNGYYCGPPPY